MASQHQALARDITVQLASPLIHNTTTRSHGCLEEQHGAGGDPPPKRPEHDGMYRSSAFPLSNEHGGRDAAAADAWQASTQQRHEYGDTTTVGINHPHRATNESIEAPQTSTSRTSSTHTSTTTREATGSVRKARAEITQRQAAAAKSAIAPSTPSAWQRLQGKASAATLRSRKPLENLRRFGSTTSLPSSSAALASPSSPSPPPPVPEIPREYRQEAARAVTARAAQLAGGMTAPRQRLSPEPAGRAPPRATGVRLAPPIAGSLEPIPPTPPSVNEHLVPQRAPVVPWESSPRPPPLSPGHGALALLQSITPRHKGSAAHLRDGASTPATPSGQSWPKHPDDPNWDDAVARVKAEMREEQEKERREQKAAAKAPKTAVAKEGGDKRFKWAKKAIQSMSKRGDETGYDLKKAPGDMTDEDWQSVVNDFANNNTIGLRNTYFRKRADPDNAIEAVNEAIAHHAKEMEKKYERLERLGNPHAAAALKEHREKQAQATIGLGITSQSPSLPGTAISTNIKPPRERFRTMISPNRPLPPLPSTARSGINFFPPRSPYSIISPRSPDNTTPATRQLHSYRSPYSSRPPPGHNAFADAENAGSNITPRARRFHYPESTASPSPSPTPSRSSELSGDSTPRGRTERMTKGFNTEFNLRLSGTMSKDVKEYLKDRLENVPEIDEDEPVRKKITPPAIHPVLRMVHPALRSQASNASFDCTPFSAAVTASPRIPPPSSSALPVHPALRGQASTASFDCAPFTAATTERIAPLSSPALSVHPALRGQASNASFNYAQSAAAGTERIAPLSSSALPIHPALRGRAVTGPVSSAAVVGSSAVAAVSTTTTDSASSVSDLPLRGPPPIPARNPARLQQRRATDSELRRTQGLSVEIENVINTWEAASPTSPTSPPPANPNASTAETLRQECGLSPLLRRQTGEQKHPHHNFSWDTAKVMCRRIHNPGYILPSPPQLPRGEAVHMSDFEDQHFTSSPSLNLRPQPPKRCADCGTFCCHFGALLSHAATVSTGSSNDLLVEAARLRAENEMKTLKVRKPVGVEEFETFLKCEACKEVFCPGCVRLCAEELCGEPICKGCVEASEFCGLHCMF